MESISKNREEAALKLCLKFKSVIKCKDIVDMALVRGGVLLGKIIADYFKASLDILVIKKIGVFQNNELIIGSVGSKNTAYWNNDLCQVLGLSKNEKEIIEREKLFERCYIDIKNKSVILVDEEVAMGVTVIATEIFLKKEKAQEIILAIPVISKNILFNIRRYFDDICSLKNVKDFYAGGQFYRNFP